MNHKHIKHLKIIIISVLIVIIVLSGAIFAVFQLNPFNSGKQNNAENVEASKQLIAESKEKVAQLDSQLGVMPSKDEINQAQNKLTQLTEDATSDEAKQVYINKSIQLYVNNDEFKSALTLALEAEQIKPTALTADHLAYIYKCLDDYKNAAKYYQLAADRSEKTNNPKARCPYNDYLILKREVEALIK